MPEEREDEQGTGGNDDEQRTDDYGMIFTVEAVDGPNDVGNEKDGEGYG